MNRAPARLAGRTGRRISDAGVAFWCRVGALIALAPSLWAADPIPSVVDAPGRETNQTWWAFQPVRRPVVPANAVGGSPIDAFVQVGLQARHLVVNPRAGRRALIRRASFDLIGLPPSPAAVAAFEADSRPDAWERVVDRLLASPLHGERWARHWLDVMRFAQSNGYERDGEKPFAWRYRDYVVRSLNADKPYDRFVREHLAGDELEPYSPDAVIATGFARLGVLDDEPDDRLTASFDELDDVLSTTGTAFLGLTLGCARCHDHKFDPIPQVEYYKLLAFFRGVRPSEKTSDPRESTAHGWLAPPGELAGWWAGHADKIRDLEARVAAATPEGQALLKRDLDGLRKESPPYERALVMREIGPQPPTTTLLRRGNAHQPGGEVAPGFLGVLGRAELEIPPVATNAPSSGRRRVLAEWIANPENPLTARVIVNRVWHHHFGRGIVATTGDFGRVGARPTHPELLDWLADEFMANGWSLKRLHKLIMLSEAYQRSSQMPDPGTTPDPVAVDPGNDFLWRGNLRRLEAEAIRDSVLAISGRLNLVPGGRGFFPHLDGEVLAGGSRPGTDWEVSSTAEQSRRSLYAYVRRTSPVPFLETLDYANYTSPLTERPTTTVAPQALLLLNDGFMHAQAVAFAARVSAGVGHGASDEALIAETYRLAFGRGVSVRETGLGRRFLARQREGFGRRPTRLEFRADVPATMNITYFSQLGPEEFMRVPAGWVARRGNWPDQYEGNRILQRGNGPFAILPGLSFKDGTLRARLLLHTASEGCGLLLRVSNEADRPEGYEVVLDPREQGVALRRHGTNILTLAAVPCAVPTGEELGLRIEADGATWKVWVGAGDEPVLKVTDPAPLAGAGVIGVRAWGAALSIDDLGMETGGRRTPIGPAPGRTDAARQALETFCLLILNLNETVYVE